MTRRDLVSRNLHLGGFCFLGLFERLRIEFRLHAFDSIVVEIRPGFVQRSSVHVAEKVQSYGKHGSLKSMMVRRLKLGEEKGRERFDAKRKKN